MHATRLHTSSYSAFRLTVRAECISGPYVVAPAIFTGRKAVGHPGVVRRVCTVTVQCRCTDTVGSNLEAVRTVLLSNRVQELG